MRSLVTLVLAVVGCGSKGSERDDGKVVPFRPAPAVEAVTQKYPGPIGAPACAPLALAIVEEGVWLGTKPDGRCFAARVGTSLDIAWLEIELKTAQRNQDCIPTSLVISAPADTRYQDVVTAMDTIMKSGIPDVTVASMDALPVKLDGDPAKAPRACPDPVVASNVPAKPSSAQGTRDLSAVLDKALPLEPATAVADAPVVVLTRTELVVSGTRVAAIADLARDAGTITALVNALPPKPASGAIVVEADASTDMKVMVRVIDTVKAAGYDHVMFAVKNK